MSIIYRLVYNVSTIVQLYRGGQLYLGMKPKYLEKTTDLSQVNDKLHHIILHRVHPAINVKHSSSRPHCNGNPYISFGHFNLHEYTFLKLWFDWL
jgi:hypothetical protein